MVARELGFPGWAAAKRALGEAGGGEDFGALLCPAPRYGGHGHVNLWYTRHAEAARVRAARGGYLLAYRRHYFVVDRHSIESLGLDPGDAEWARLGFDWARPLDVQARARLSAKLVAWLPREHA